MSGLNELYAYLVEDDEGYVAPAMMELASGVRFTLVAPNHRQAMALLPIAEKLAGILSKEIRLVRFTHPEEMEVLKP